MFESADDQTNSSRGPNWIHGTDHNPILDLAHETGTIPFSFDEHVSVIDESGKSMSEEKAGEFSELTWGIIADAFKHSNNHSATIPPDQSLMDFFKQKVDEKALEPEDKKTILQMASMWGAFVGDPIERQSLKFFWLEECIDGGETLSNPQQLYLAELITKKTCSSPAPTKLFSTVLLGQRWKKPMSG